LRRAGIPGRQADRGFVREAETSQAAGRSLELSVKAQIYLTDIADEPPIAVVLGTSTNPELPVL
jgi:hypothetical protein